METKISKRIFSLLTLSILIIANCTPSNFVKAESNNESLNLSRKDDNKVLDSSTNSFQSVDTRDQTSEEKLQQESTSKTITMEDEKNSTNTTTESTVNNGARAVRNAEIDGKIWTPEDGSKFLSNWSFDLWHGYNGASFYILNYYKGTDTNIIIPGFVPTPSGGRTILVRSINKSSNDYFLRKTNDNSVSYQNITSIKFAKAKIEGVNRTDSVGVLVNNTSAQNMLSGATNLKTADLSGLVTTNVPNGRNYSSINNFSHAFDGCSNLTNVTLPTNNISTDTSYMFNNCTSLQNINNLGTSADNFSTVKSTNTSYMFKGTKISNFPVLDYSATTTLTHMFDSCTNISNLNSPIYANNATDASYMFSNCTGLKNTAVISGSKLTNMSYMYSNCTGMESTLNLTFPSFSTYAPVNNMSHMFEGCTSLNWIDFRWLKPVSGTDMSYMFAGCTSLTDPTCNYFDTSVASNMSNMFDGCTSLQNSFVSSNKLNTTNATNLSSMFARCTSLTNIKPTFNTSKVTNMSYMFYDCRNLDTADLSTFNTSNVTDMSYMFSGTYNLTNINVSTFDTSKVNSMLFMFGYTTKLRYIDLSNFKINSHASLVKLFYTNSPTPLLVVAGATNGNSLYDYNYNSDNRVPVDTPRLDANGGNFGNNKTTMNYFDRICIYSNDSKLNMATFNQWLNANHPSKSGTAFVRWTPNNNASTIENMVKTGTVYQAEWILVPNTSNENRKTGSLGILSIAYIPNSFSTGQSGIDLNNSGEQHIPFVGNNSMSIGVRDQQMKKSTWKLNARLNWNGKSPNGGAYIKIGESSYISQNINNGLTVYNPTTDLKSIQNVIVENNKIISTSDSTIISNNGNALNGVYDYNLGNISFVLSDSKQVGIGNYGATVTWNLSTTP